MYGLWFWAIVIIILKLVYTKSKLACTCLYVQFLYVPLRNFACYDCHNCISSCTVVLPDTEMALNLSAEDEILSVKVIKFNISVLSKCV